MTRKGTELEGVQIAIEKEWREREDMEDRANLCDKGGMEEAGSRKDEAENGLPDPSNMEGVEDASPVGTPIACNEDVAYVLGEYM